jgi:hypothetical protein
MADPGVTVRDWFEVLDPEGAALPRAEWDRERLRRLHGLQICQDVIAHVQNVPLRLVRLRSLQQLDKTFVSFVDKWHGQIRDIITDENHRPRRKHCLPAADADALLEAMRDPRHVATLRDWVLAMADGEVERPNLPPHYETWFLELLPHLERDVWLTDMSNAMPVHNLARMVEHWALYVLMWAWKHLHDYDPHLNGAPRYIPSVLGMPQLGLLMHDSLRRRGKLSGENTQTVNEHPIGLLVGPFEIETRGGSSIDDQGEHNWFVERLFGFVRGAARFEAWADVWGKVPSADELADAFATSAPLSEVEARRRLQLAEASLHALLDARLDPSVNCNPNGQAGRPISRANWESAAALCAWQNRWGQTLRECEPAKPILLKIPDHRVSLLMRRVAGDDGASRDENLLLAYADAPMHRDTLRDFVADEPVVLRLRSETRWIEPPSALLARARERQHAAWTSHIIAINNMLTRHSRRDRPVGMDRTDDAGSTLAAPHCDEADHLLRGYAGRICQYLVQLARADVATIYWVDYSIDPPQLRHVGDADRFVQHRAQRRSRLHRFNEWVLEPAIDGAKPAHAGPRSAAQVYRCAATAAIDPPVSERLAGPDGPTKVRAKFDHYAEPQPQDGVAVPLLFNGRVVGVFVLESIGTIREFDARLHPPLRRVAQLLAHVMYFQSEIWHMRRLNWLASHRPLEQWRRHDDENRFNPLRAVAHNLANIFLCPVVHIWLQDPANPERFKLHGYTRDAMFMPHGRPLMSAPITMIPAEPRTGAVELSYPFIALAVDQWRERRQEDWPVGHFVQARFHGGTEVTRPPYSLAAAERGDLVLGKDFADAWLDKDIGGRDPRRRMFEDQGLTQVMAFALVNTSAEAPDPVGIVTLHAPSATPANGHGHAPWPSGWWPVVAHVQTYLLYVLMQTETIANPLDNLRRYLLHEGRNELNGVAIMVADLRTVVNRLLAPDRAMGGRIRPWLRARLPELRQLRKASAADPSMAWLGDVVDELTLTERSLEEVSRKALPLVDPERAENFSILARLIEVQRDLASLGDANLANRYDHETSWVNLRDQIVDSMSHYEPIFKSAGIWTDSDTIPARTSILTSEVLWRWMLNDLTHNLAKYALGSTAVTVAFARDEADRDLYRLRFQNISSFDPERDQPARLMLHGVQGSAGLRPPRVLPANARISRKGTGIGVWGVSVLAKVLGMELGITVDPTANPVAGKAAAVYRFDLSIPSRLVSRQ